MGTICIFLGLIIFLGSIFLGFAAARALLRSQLVASAPNFFPFLTSPTTTHIIIVGVIGFIGLLICLNLVMHGLTYNKVCKLKRSIRNRH